MDMTLDQAADRINQHPDLTATVQRNQIAISVYRRPAGYVTEADLDDLTTSTGWGKNLRKGALAVWKSLTAE
jgi:pterin-4a-carbinolamine dehydratase